MKHVIFQWDTKKKQLSLSIQISCLMSLVCASGRKDDQQPKQAVYCHMTELLLERCSTKEYFNQHFWKQKKIIKVKSKYSSYFNKKQVLMKKQDSL